MSADDTTKTFYTGDDTTIVLTRNKTNGHFKAVCRNFEADIPPDHYVEIVMKHGRLEATRRPIQVLPTYEQVIDLLDYDQQTRMVMKLFGIKDPKPTTRPVDEYTGD